MLSNFKKNKKRRNAKSIFFLIFFGVLLLVGIGFLSWTNIKIKQRREKLLSRIESIKKEIQMLEEKNKDLKEQVSQSGTPEYLEKVAREQFGLKAPGEEVVIISKENEEKEEVKAEEEQGWWQKIKNFFKF